MMAAYAGSATTSEWPQTQLQPPQTNGIQTLAMPAIIGQQQPQQQYSPQDTSNGSNSSQYYQQQLIKSAQQQFAVQQQQQQQQRMNGIPTTVGEGLYNGIGRPAPIYAPKPTYYSQQPQPQPQQQQQQPQPVYQQTRAFYTTQQQQQQHSPASSGLLQQPTSQLTATGLSVRHLPQATNLQQQQQQQQSQQNSPQSNHLQQQPQPQMQVQSNHPQQMQQLIMSYQQQQQLQPILSAPQQAIPNFINNYNSAPNIMSQENIQQHQQEAARRSQIEEQHRLIQQQHLRQSARATDAAARFSDRDSVSTVSRFNQLDDRRSFTMRSQYTSGANNSAKYSRKFGFLELTGEAIKRILGLANDDSNKLLSPLVVSSDGKNQAAANKITSIDSGEDHYFKRKVFKYQLVIMRLVSFLCAAFVLLSPVAMLLIPKLESILNNSQTADVGQQQDSSLLPTPAAGHGVTHGVGLSGANKQQVNHYFVPPQPQWRISECSSDCDGPLIGFFARFIMLCLAYWAIFFRSQTSSLPRIDFHRCLLISMSVLLTLAYWLFFIFRVFDKRYNDFELQYMTIVQFALSMLESLILLHYLAVVLLELRQRKKIYCLKVVRSPDGASQYLSCGSLSIQKCAQFVLEKYHREFTSYTPYHEHLLELEDELAKSLASSSSTSRDHHHHHHHRQAGNGDGDGGEPSSSRSRPGSPAISTGGRSTSRHHHRPSRHHSRSQHRSPSRSPIRSSRSRSQRKSSAADQQQNSSNNSTKYQVDLKPPQQQQQQQQDNQEENSKKKPSATNNNNNSPQEQKIDNQQKNQLSGENDSADQSSDATSRMKESSLETIRAANSTSELLGSSSSQRQPAASAKQQQQQNQHQQRSSSRAREEQRDETESVRSVRSRRSTKSHHRSSHHNHHHSGHRERSSSRMNDHHHADEDGHDEDYSSRRRPTSVSIPIGGGGNSLDEQQLQEHERKLRRRKYRLLQAVQDTFEQIRQIDDAQQNGQQVTDGSNGSLQQPSPALSSNQAARSLYPSMARSLQKYLRLTKQTGRHNLQSIYEHLSKCLLYRLSPRAFLEKFLKQDPVWQQSETNLFARCRLPDSILMNHGRFNDDDLEINSWSLVCDTLLSRQIDSGTFFVLKQGQVSLLVTVAKLPHLNLTEEVIDSKSCKFALAPNSETSV